MSTRTVEQVDSWNTVPFSGGYGGLHDLADSDFSGAVVAGPTRLFMLNGKVVGVLDGSVEDFESASGTAREAPHPGLPLLAVMQERSEEVRAKYYTEDTPIADVDQTLSSGGFTGYVELSENVLSGDYYQIYHQGRSMSVAWVGNSDELITEDEAFEQANNEVGIYEVRPVDIEIIDIPESSGDDGAGVGTVGATGDDGAEGGSSVSSAPTGTGDGRPADRGAETDDPEPSRGSLDADPVAKTATDTRTAGIGSNDTRQQTDDRTATESGERERGRETGARQEPDTTPDRSSDERREPDAGREDDEGRAADASAEPRERTEERGPDRSAEPAQPSARTTEDRRAETERPVASEPAEQATPDQSGALEREGTTDPSGIGPAPNDPSTSGAADLETRSIPSLDPSKTDTASSSANQTGEPSTGRAAGAGSGTGEPRGSNGPGDDHPAAPGGGPARSESSGRDEPRQQSADPEPAQPRSDPERSRDPAPEPDPQLNAGGGQSERVAELEAALEETAAERDELQSELERLTEERDDLQRELDEARTEIERLEERLSEMAPEDDTTPDAGTRLSQREAIDQTNLFVRYNSKGDATLESVHSGNAEQSAVDDNLRLEYHTQFDADDAAVGSEPFETFLTESIQYRYVDWLVRNLLYEIRDTGNPESMAELYDALPKIDRAELNGQVSVEYTEDGEQHRAQEQFDVVVRDRMGNPLIVANINDSRNPATDDMMTDLITRAERVGQSSESLAGAFLVTESFFEPPALETAEEATSSGLLSRDKRKSFVNLSRKDGYHLCLVEARNKEFHLAVPEL